MKTLTHKFVESIPEQLEADVLYICINYGTVVHKCCCGCGREVVTPLSPTDWKLTFDGETVSLDPSIGNWNFPCQSHYWIENNRIHWARKMSKQQIKAGQQHDRKMKADYYSKVEQPEEQDRNVDAENLPSAILEEKNTFWSKLKMWWLE